MKAKIVTNFPIAYCKDHFEPYGTAYDNSKNGLYVRELISRCGPDMKYMDLGCAGGGFVRQFVKNSNIFAVGVEGSDFSQKNKRAEWDVIPDYLFTADITKPFYFLDENDEKIKFDAISSFDVLEHISVNDLPNVINNIKDNLTDNGIFIASIATFQDAENYHVTCELKPWWDNLFNSYGFVEDIPMTYYGRRAEYSHNIETDFEVVYKKV
jgi:SAM-dependent methyltransferase